MMTMYQIGMMILCSNNKYTTIKIYINYKSRENLLKKKNNK